MAKRYYWIKLKEDFFDDDAINWLEEQPKGKAYALFYLKLCLKSIKTNGILIRTVGTMLVPYDMKKLSEITKTDFDTVVVAMELLKTIGLVEILENGEIFLPRLPEMVGSETDKAVLMRIKREQEKIASNAKGNNVTSVLPDCYSSMDGNNVTSPLPNCYTEIRDRERDKEIDIEEKEIVEPLANDTIQPVAQVDKNPVGDFEYQCVDMIIKSCIETFPNSKVPTTSSEKKKWALDIERMKRLDKRSEAEIIEALTYATTDTFWKSNIRSAKKLREKFETLIMQSRAKARGLQMGTKPRSMTTEQYAESIRGWND